MFILKSNGKHAIPLADSRDIELLHTIGANHIALLIDGKAILTRLVDSGYLVEGNY